MSLSARGFLMAAAFACALAIGACGGDDDSSVTTAGPPTVPGGQAGTADVGTPSVGVSTPAIGTVLIATAGGRQVLTDATGFTLYVFDHDEADAGTSACFASCAQAWPPFAVIGAPTGPPELTGTLGTINRDDGTTQATYKGKPLYRFTNDEAPGDTNGDGVGGTWSVATP